MPIISSFFQVLSVLSRLINMASTGQKRKADFAFPDYVVKSLECPVCLETAEGDIYSCQEQHLICSTCRPKVTECPECRVAYKFPLRRHRYAEKTAVELRKLREELSQLLEGD